MANTYAKMKERFRAAPLGLDVPHASRIFSPMAIAEQQRIVAKVDELLRWSGALHGRLGAVGLAALLAQTVKIDTSPFILSPFELEGKPTIRERAFKGEPYYACP
jgi:hypothetical protein